MYLEKVCIIIFLRYIEKSITTYIDYGFTEKLAIKIFIRSEQLS